MSSFDVQKIRNEFPILNQSVHNKPLVYLDNAATTQKPKVVIDTINDYYTSTNANIHRGIHFLAEKATAEFEATREAVKDYIGSKQVEEIIFTKGTTDGINLVANTYGRQNLSKGDEVIISHLEHHSNIVPWQMICEQTGALLKVIPMNEKGELILSDFKALLSSKTKIVSVNHASNALGSINPIKEIISLSHEQGAKVVIDAAQTIAHLPIDVQELDIDFLVFSAHKMYGPTGVGVLYGKYELLNDMPPYQGGGEMINEVSFEKTTYNTPPFKFEAGTPNIGDIIAFKEAIMFITNIGLENISKHENEICAYAREELSKVPKIKFIGTSDNRVSVISFIIEGMHHYDIGMMLDARGIAIRTGHHCTQPIMKFFNIEGTNRASFSVYNTLEEVDQLVAGLKKIVTLFGS